MSKQTSATILTAWLPGALSIFPRGWLASSYSYTTLAAGVQALASAAHSLRTSCHTRAATPQASSSAVSTLFRALTASDD
ncbi:hypothetical protein BX600DRAFT_467119 [Xylariales sp. PMI_506]|nr:hypothetical protein BX600DRAFT_467119 [Xylariales sp. PMI_506]